MTFNLNSFLIALSTALDYAEHEIMDITTHHSKRCAYIVLRLAQEMGMTQEECFDLCSLALMHDNGITQAFLAQNFLEAGSSNNLPLLEHLKEHCSIGEKNIKDFPFLTSPKNIILYHHEYLDGSGLYGKKGDQIPLMAQVICFADELDLNFDLLHTSVENLDELNQFITDKSYLFRKDISDAFLRISKKISFWRDLRDDNIIQALKEHLPHFSIDIKTSELLAMTAVFSRIIDSKSHFTAAHSSDLMDKAALLGNYLTWDQEKTIKFQMAANLHDIGKLAMPSAILEKNGPLSREEFNTIKEHAYISHLILGNIEGFEDIHLWASTHHERLNGSGYPFGYTEEKLCFESKLLATLDMYQALTENRPYRQAMSHEESINIMLESAKNGFLDLGIINTLDQIFGLAPLERAKASPQTILKMHQSFDIK